MITNQQLDVFREQGFTHVVIQHKMLADTLTPVSIYQKLGATAYSYLLESIEGGERWARFSVVGLPASERIIAKDGHIKHYIDHELDAEYDGNPLDWLQHYYKQRKVANIPENIPFSGGLVGYFGFDSISYIEPRLSQRLSNDPLDVPDVLFLVSDRMVVMDTLKGEANILITIDLTISDVIAYAEKEIESIISKLNAHQDNNILNMTDNPSVSFNPEYEMSADAYKDAVRLIKDYIVAGDVMQVVPSQRLSVPYHRNPLDLYRALRITNPSPYMYILNMDDHQIVGSSPEILARVEGRKAIVRPIAGTRKRGKTASEDLALEKELLADEKELSEHAMLIDLGRNDLGRVSEAGTVKITDKMAIERYSHVMHIASNIEGQLQAGLDGIDVFKATFPAGTLSGASKIRAIEILDEVEISRRGIYGGAIGYLAWNGDMDLAIAIRTGIIKNNQLYAQAGAGIVYDSDPDLEWEETINKLAALIKAYSMLQ